VGEQSRWPAASVEKTPRQSVWQHDDATIRGLGENPPASHWSLEITQPFGPRWPAPMRRRLARRQTAIAPGHQGRALGMGAGFGVLLTVAVLGLLLLLASANGWLAGSAPAAPDSSQWPIPAQTTPQTPAGKTPQPAATSLPTSTVLPTVTAQPTATSASEPTPTAAPTATVTTP
jgi:hypothetical protein